MIARKYTKHVELWVTSTVPDGYGGNTVTTSLVQNLWANVTAKSSNRLNENGQNDNFMQTVFTIRNRFDLVLSIKDNFFKNNGLIYNIDSVLNIDLDNIDIQIYATQRT
jgi:SPP1 family predicted phage head-tail adaptor